MGQVKGTSPDLFGCTAHDAQAPLAAVAAFVQPVVLLLDNADSDSTLPLKKRTAIGGTVATVTSRPPGGSFKAPKTSKYAGQRTLSHRLTEF